VKPIERLSGKEYAKPIVIANNVWVDGGVIICPAVKIGDNVTIGAGSVVTKDILWFTLIRKDKNNRTTK